MKIERNHLIIAVIGIILLSFVTMQFEVVDVVKASLEGGDEVWTNLDVEYREYMDGAMATVTADFNNNKMFETSDEFGNDIYYATYNFTSFDFRLRSIEDTDAYPVGINHLSDDDVDLPRDETYNMRFDVRDLVPGEPIKVELTAKGYEEGDRRTVIEESLSFTLESPVYSEPESEAPGFSLIFTVFVLLSVTYIINRRQVNRK